MILPGVQTAPDNLKFIFACQARFFLDSSGADSSAKVKYLQHKNGPVDGRRC